MAAAAPSADDATSVQLAADAIATIPPYVPPTLSDDITNVAATLDLHVLKKLMKHHERLQAKKMMENKTAVSPIINRDTNMIIAVNASDKNGMSALAKCCEWNRTDCVQWLLAKRANPNVADHNGYDALSAASGQGASSCVSLLLRARASATYIGGAGYNAIHYAVMEHGEGYSDTLRLLIDYGAPIDMGNDQGWTPLHGALAHQQLQHVHTLIMAGADVTRRDLKGRMIEQKATPDQLIAIHQSMEARRQLLLNSSLASTVRVSPNAPLAPIQPPLVPLSVILPVAVPSSPSSSSSSSLYQPIATIGCGTGSLFDVSIYDALAIGYRHFDTAISYGNTVMIGAAIRAAQSPPLRLARRDIWITSKISSADIQLQWTSTHQDATAIGSADDGTCGVAYAVQQALKQLDTIWIDVMYLHTVTDDMGRQLPWQLLLIELNEQRLHGRIHHIGVANVNVAQLQSLLTLADTLCIPITHVQIECHLLCPQHAIRALCASRGITVTGFRILGGTTLQQRTSSAAAASYATILHHRVVLDIARDHDTTASAIAMAWSLRHHITIIPMTNNRLHMIDNLREVWRVTPLLTTSQLATLNTLHHQYASAMHAASDTKTMMIKPILQSARHWTWLPHVDDDAERIAVHSSTHGSTRDVFPLTMSSSTSGSSPSSIAAASVATVSDPGSELVWTHANIPLPIISPHDTLAPIPDDSSSDVRTIANEIIHGRGYAVIPNFLSGQRFIDVKTRVDQLYDEQGRPKRMWQLMNGGIILEQLISDKRLYQIVEHVVGPLPRLGAYSANTLSYGTEMGSIHIHHPYHSMKWPFPSGVNMECSMILMMHDFTLENGATWVIDHSHKLASFPPSCDTAFHSRARQITGKAGTLLLAHGLLWHRSGANRTLNDRMALLAQFLPRYVQPMVATDYVIPEVFQRANKRLKYLLGYKWMALTIKDMGIWNERKEQKKIKSKDVSTSLVDATPTCISVPSDTLIAAPVIPMATASPLSAATTVVTI